MSELCKCRVRWNGRTERRTHPRRAVLPTVTCAVKVRSNEVLSPATIINVSVGGIRLSTCKRLGPGDPALVELRNPVSGFARLKLTRITHTLQTADGECLAGGAFANELSVEESRALFGAA